MKKKLNVLSLFGGMECGRIALDELGFEYCNYYYSEIDKFASKQVEINFPDIIHLGDVEKWRKWDIDWSSLDLVFGGSPCQGFSFAGKMLAFDDPRSKLFFTFLDIVNHVKSCNSNMKFMLENVNMKKDYLNEITRLMGVEPLNINSNLVSAQNRNRWYWTNISDKIEQPSDRGIYLKDILEDEVDEKYYLSEDKLSSGYMSRNYLQIDSSGLGHKSQNDRFYYPNSKHASLTARGTKGKTGVYLDQPMCVAMRGRYFDGVARQVLEDNITGKTNCLTSVQKDNLVSGVSVNMERYIRRLTPSECAKLQTIPSWYKWDCSDTQKYKMLGNGWTVEVIKHIFSYL